ncbi:hypothetical protein N7491_006081 [Penicillium cf. griseofulvum]|uniref:AA1-like domain-containing protein n=1 Tax=Penicillium cf. griseofulvum TaxID=2972120 RepID=A0A9W9IXC8_9EURO|nr:hypothetical protein N7472_010888 [Penicillium cf. griseofulvum]KAJ5429065.1 hypothetical protein N7491_006081 [Penicillium cf. griseofulvum]KAJ5437140.1 hypothetical protein N7445_008025 [Penicillium cf. griseofulvum]
MKFPVVFLLLAASAALAVPIVERDSSIQISDFWARASAGSSATMHFVATDPNYPDDTPTDCNLIWTYGSSPKETARCNNCQYFIHFPNGAVDFNQFTLGLERVSGPIAENGQVLLSSGTEWSCVDNPESGVQLSCTYNGPLSIPV